MGRHELFLMRARSREPRVYCVDGGRVVCWTRAEDGIRVNCIMPYPTDTPMVDRLGPDHSAGLLSDCG